MRRWLRIKELGLVGILMALTATSWMALPSFRSGIMASQILENSTLIILLALGEAVVMVTRQIDLSVGAIMGLTAYVVGSWIGHLGGGQANPVLAVLLSMAMGSVMGLGNAVLVDRARMPAIIATLATLSIYSGLQVVVTGGSQLYAYQLPGWLANLLSVSWLGIPSFIWIAAILVLSLSVAMRSTRWGRDLYAMGSSPEHAAYAGVRTRLRTFQAFGLCGAVSGLAGLLYAAQYGNVDATAGAGMELTAIAAAVIGGVSLFGGSGSAVGAALGAVLLLEIETILAILKISIFAQQTLQGVAIIASVTLYAVLGRVGRSSRRGGRGDSATLEPRGRAALGAVETGEKA